MEHGPYDGREGEGLPGSRGEHLLQSLFSTRERALRFYDRQVVDRLTPEMQEFVARQEMAFIGTSDAAGNCDTSFRAGPPGFVRVLDPGRLIYPEFRGNGVLASMGNIMENAHLSLLFVDFFDDLVGLHVNGAATITTAYDAARRHGLTDEDQTAPGRRADRWVMVEVEEAYIHCSKHIPLLARQDRRRRDAEGRRPSGDDHFGVAATRGRERERQEAGRSAE
ncbi:pyridoxamine 5'-phosphate oxidase family protein [Sphaerisporangium sp. NBC_01403]|uniref:pyridoxamine 5'-phosphate oxidase family protein n=1 Tax=Sphaerisporangium sp. NBC_01403 TaxID=2903599 RepID=UPI0032459E82